ncbi:MAG: universal stress protein [Deltaproteobacteria bacterium]|nr:universal stress protein [Deltaproteobacteria bacterium]
MGLSRAETKRVLVVALTIGAVTALHYGTDAHHLHLHVVFRELYFVPILLAVVGFGLRGGLVAAAVITAVYAPHVATSIHTAESTVGNALQLVFFHLIGAAVGAYTDMRRRHQAADQGDPDPTPGRFPQQVLVVVDHGPAGMQAAEFAGALFAKDDAAGLTLASVCEEPKADYFASAEAHAAEAACAAARAEAGVQRAAMVLAKRGVPEERIATRVLRADGRPSDAILREQDHGAYDVIVVGRRRLTRAEEYLFGDVAVRLTRRASCPVIVVSGPSEGGGTPAHEGAAAQADPGPATGARGS